VALVPTHAPSSSGERRLRGNGIATTLRLSPRLLAAGALTYGAFLPRGKTLYSRLGCLFVAWHDVLFTWTALFALPVTLPVCSASFSAFPACLFRRSFAFRGMKRQISGRKAQRRNGAASYPPKLAGGCAWPLAGSPQRAHLHHAPRNRVKRDMAAAAKSSGVWGGTLKTLPTTRRGGELPTHRGVTRTRRWATLYSTALHCWRRTAWAATWRDL